MFRTCKVGGKNTEALRGEDDFSTPPGGLDLACTIRTRVTFACELRELGYGTDVILDLDYFWNHREDYTRKIPVFRGKTLSLQKDKELFDSMRNIVILNSLHFSYPLPILMRVSYNTLIVKQNTSDYYKYSKSLGKKGYSEIMSENESKSKCNITKAEFCPAEVLFPGQTDDITKFLR